jgi:hypothetical protein
MVQRLPIQRGQVNEMELAKRQQSAISPVYRTATEN